MIWIFCIRYFVFLKERDSFSLQLEKIEDKAMKSFATTTMLSESEKEAAELELDTAVIKQIGELKKKIGMFLSVF